MFLPGVPREVKSLKQRVVALKLTVLGLEDSELVMFKALTAANC